MILNYLLLTIFSIIFSIKLFIKSPFDLKKSTEFNMFLLLNLNFLYSQNNS